MTLCKTDDLRDLPQDHPQRLVMVAHARLAARPASANGMKSATVAAYGEHMVRLIMLSHSPASAFASIWLELYDTAADIALDGHGCNDLSEAMAAAEELLAEAKSLNARSVTCGHKGRRRR